MTPIDQLKGYFDKNHVEYDMEFSKFVNGVVAKGNIEYCEDGGTIFKVHLLLYNTITNKYDCEEFDEVGNKDAASIVVKVTHRMLGIIHPWYCIGYCIVADGFVSEYNLEDATEEEREEAIRISSQLSPVEDPLAKEMLMYNMIPIIGEKNMRTYEIMRIDGGVFVKDSNIGGKIGSHISGHFVEIFDRAQEARINMQEEFGELYKDYLNRNIFE